MAKICMNEGCQATTTIEWKKGWELKSGSSANLCYNCGCAYEKLVYCETFHLEESGWRECRLCGKKVHCGCIVSKYSHEYLDFGGVQCIGCARSSEARSIRSLQFRNDDIPNGFHPSKANNIAGLQSSLLENSTGDNCVEKAKLMQLCRAMDTKELSQFSQTQRNETTASIEQAKKDHTVPRAVGLSISAEPGNNRPILGLKNIYASLAQPSLSFSFKTPPGTSNSLLASPSRVVEGKELNKVPPFQQGQRSQHNTPKPPKTSLAIGSESSTKPPKTGVTTGSESDTISPKTALNIGLESNAQTPKTGLTIGSEPNKGMVSQARVARPPAQGRGRHQLLPRYWPRITDQELQQISGDLNSTVVPLFEKVLSASDAGRIGRLVLPKACAEAYFPPISQSDGLPIKIQDIKGKEWTFQFRFWPNNNSRMYVLEGITPCIQNMQLQAGDTVIFSRIEPGSKLVMGFRKTSNSAEMQDSQTTPALPNGASSGEASFSGVPDNLPTHGGSTNEASSKKPTESSSKKPTDASSKKPMLSSEKKKARNIGSKSKRLLMNSEEALELRVTWEEAQELLRPSPSAKPSIVVIEDQEVEEYDEPPVFGKRTIFTSRASGEHEQWAQCDSCSKWRRLPIDVLLPPQWTCLDNIWDPIRCSCSASDEMNPVELETLLRVGKDSKKRRIVESPDEEPREPEPSGLDALATAAILGDNAGDTGESSAGATTKHPRHRPGCSCIVCIQPPSGKGKHKPTCICNVCTTVRRRFKTLMLRRRQRQSEGVAESIQGKQAEDGSEMDFTSGDALLRINEPEDDGSEKGTANEVVENDKGQLDLNCDPSREEDMVPTEATDLNVMSLVNASNLPLEMYLRHNGLTNLDPCLLSQAPGESDGPLAGEGCVEEHENDRDER